MSKKVIYTSNAPTPIGAYSQAIEVGGIVYVSGQIPLDAISGAIMSEGIEKQAHKVMQNIKAILKKADLDFSNVVKCSIFLSDMSHFAIVDSIYSKHFEDTPPARETVAVKGLPKGVDVEISCVATRH